MVVLLITDSATIPFKSDIGEQLLVTPQPLLFHMADSHGVTGEVSLGRKPTNLFLNR
jgi:hypothetical protein